MNEAAGSLPRIEVEQRSFVVKVYGWMFLALLATAGVALLVASTPALVKAVVGSPGLFWGLIIGQVALVWILSAAINRLPAVAATLMFLVYAALNGVTLSVIFLAYTASSIFSTFAVTAGTFGAMCAYGHFTKADLTSVGNLCFMALIGLIIGSIVNLFFFSETLYWIMTYAGIIIFVGLTAYDAQKIKAMSGAEEEGYEVARKAAVLGALAIYLDFINLFLLLLRILGRRR